MNNVDMLDITSKQTGALYDWTLNLIEQTGLSDRLAHIVTSAGLLIVAFLILYILDMVISAIFNTILTKIITNTKTKWDDLLIRNKSLNHLSHLILIIVAQQMIPFIFIGFPNFTAGLNKFLSILVILSFYMLINSLLKTGRDILRLSKAFVDKPLDSYLQVTQIFFIFVIGTLIFSVLTGNSPWQFLVSLGAASAILMLVFKDTILGFVASIQVSANDSVRVGDWIEMPKYGVDGDVLEINLNKVKVQNFDKTVISVPTYTLLSDAFKNYRGMQDSGGRRIKRAIHIKISSIRYLTDDEIAVLKKIQLLAPYIATREEEIRAYNQRTGADDSMLVNGRRMTNVGLFRAYISAYARHNPDIHKGLTFMVRQLAPNEHGLPLELYMFTNGTEWAFFENTMSDLFDHLFAAIKYFHLEVFELPASDDLRYLISEGDFIAANKKAAAK
ncbi:mechanosensitive ion channel family protein [Sphingobacterium gobiense]|uniref:Mechanosensitive ion channel protein MscS n=1 Tax=Sphingobacterium gobiense TaxID=1382456 RepID=A0A2S9JN41_9SPHI|nr:mechanosensitive ion channel domain-containing protein [Sphingobacterium gobiense]PRD54554.1 mechanosensitive ion channel protein MscS [Sphingobacterium gobiense]